MSATGIVFLALSVVMLGLGFYGASVDVVSATGLAESIGQMKNFYFLLGGLILFVVLYRLVFSKASLRVQHTMSTTIRYVILIGVGVFMVYPLLWMISATFKDNNEIFSTLSLIPTRPTMEGYKAAMNNYGGDINIWQAMLNTYKYVIPKVIFTLVDHGLRLRPLPLPRAQLPVRGADGDAVPAAGRAEYSAVPDVPQLRLGRFAVLSGADRADAVRAGDVFRLYADSVHAQYPARAG